MYETAPDGYNLNRAQPQHNTPEAGGNPDIMANTKISYRYVDAANYKQFMDVVIKGEISDEKKKEIFGCLYDGEFFVPGAVGLDGLQNLAGELDPDLDHAYHILDAIEPTTEDADSLALSANELATRFLGMTREGWEKAAVEWENENFAISRDIPF